MSVRFIFVLFRCSFSFVVFVFLCSFSVSVFRVRVVVMFLVLRFPFSFFVFFFSCFVSFQFRFVFVSFRFRIVSFSFRFVFVLFRFRLISFRFRFVFVSFRVRFVSFSFRFRFVSCRFVSVVSKRNETNTTRVRFVFVSFRFRFVFVLFRFRFVSCSVSVSFRFRFRFVFGFVRVVPFSFSFRVVFVSFHFNCVSLSFRFVSCSFRFVFVSFFVLFLLFSFVSFRFRFVVFRFRVVFVSFRFVFISCRFRVRVATPPPGVHRFLAIAQKEIGAGHVILFGWKQDSGLVGMVRFPVDFRVAVFVLKVRVVAGGLVPVVPLHAQGDFAFGIGCFDVDKLNSGPKVPGRLHNIGNHLESERLQGIPGLVLAICGKDLHLRTAHFGVARVLFGRVHAHHIVGEGPAFFGVEQLLVRRHRGAVKSGGNAAEDVRCCCAAAVGFGVRQVGGEHAKAEPLVFHGGCGALLTITQAMSTVAFHTVLIKKGFPFFERFGCRRSRRSGSHIGNGLCLGQVFGVRELFGKGFDVRDDIPSVLLGDDIKRRHGRAA